MSGGGRGSGIFGYGVVFFVFLALTAGVAVAPAAWLTGHSPPVPGLKPLNTSERLGERIYVAEGCAYCHTQQVRPLPGDTPAWGRPSVAGDYARLEPLDIWRMVPEITGTERTGPDLADVAARQSSRTWNYIHLYNPRAVAPASVMQGFPWLFRVVEHPDSATVVPMPDGFGPARGKVVVTPRARHLVDYILSRKQLPLPGATSAAPESTAAQPSGGAGTSSSRRGAQLYNARCASCHQANGAGVPGAFPPMKGAPAVTAADPSEHIRIVLFGLSGKEIAGKKYSAAMPSHRSMSDQQIADVINYERTSWGNHAPTVTAAQVHAIREKGPTQGGSP